MGHRRGDVKVIALAALGSFDWRAVISSRLSSATPLASHCCVLFFSTTRSISPPLPVALPFSVSSPLLYVSRCCCCVSPLLPSRHCPSLSLSSGVQLRRFRSRCFYKTQQTSETSENSRQSALPSTPLLSRSPSAHSPLPLLHPSVRCLSIAAAPRLVGRLVSSIAALLFSSLMFVASICHSHGSPLRMRSLSFSLSVPPRLVVSRLVSPRLALARSPPAMQPPR